MITLYQRTDCPFCWKVRIALAELKLEYQSVELQLGQKHTNVVAVSPTGTVPVLEDEGTAIWESSVILDYLDRKYAPGQLIPTEPDSEANVRLLQVYSDKLVGPCIKGLVFEKRSKPEHMWDKNVIQQGEEEWATCQKWLEAKLNGQAFFGDGFSAADCALAARFGIAEAYGAAVSAEFSGMHNWYQSIKARDSWEKAYPSSFIRTEK